jgi:hypothetical protein
MQKLQSGGLGFLICVASVPIGGQKGLTLLCLINSQGIDLRWVMNLFATGVGIRNLL